MHANGLVDAYLPSLLPTSGTEPDLINGFTASDAYALQHRVLLPLRCSSMHGR
jgi:hypothetical protein